MVQVEYLINNKYAYDCYSTVNITVKLHRHSEREGTHRHAHARTGTHTHAHARTRMHTPARTHALARTTDKRHARPHARTLAHARTDDRRTNDATCGPQAWLTGKLHDGGIRSVRSPLRRAPLLATPIAMPLQCGRPERSGLFVS